jgi:hypothetical protein
MKKRECGFAQNIWYVHITAYRPLNPICTHQQHAQLGYLRAVLVFQPLGIGMEGTCATCSVEYDMASHLELTLRLFAPNDIHCQPLISDLLRK